jgi:hypothetical protein
MNWFSCCVSFLWVGLFALSGFSQTETKIHISGLVTDSLNMMPLEGASIVSTNNQTLTQTTANGLFDTWVNASDSFWVIKAVGYKPQTIHLLAGKHSFGTIRLVRDIILINEVVVNAQKNGSIVQSTQSSYVELSSREIDKLPLFMGEPDLYRSVKLMPGIQSSGDGNAAIYVRGGGYDQNMIMLDEAIVYNPTHLLGFFSVFNSDVIDNVLVLKSGIPAEYGNRLSSVMKFATRQSVPGKCKVDGNIGLISSSLKLETPLFNSKAGCYIAARKTYLNQILDLAKKASLIGTHSLLYRSGYGFYDVNGGIVFTPTGNDRITLSAYTGSDLFDITADIVGVSVNMNWGNKVGSLNWYHRFSDSLYLDNSISATGYSMDMDVSQNLNYLNLVSSVTDVGYKSRLTWITPRNKIKAGCFTVFHQVQPNYSQATTSNKQLQLGNVQQLNSNETSVFLSDDITVNPWLSFSAGGRFNIFTQYGPYSDYTLDSYGSVIDTLHYKKRSVVKRYMSPDIRLSSRIMLSDNNSVKVAYNTNSQYVHLVNVSSVSFPTDFWIPSTKSIKPQYGWHLSAGYYHFLKALGLETSAEVYYKEFINQLEFGQGLFSVTENVALDKSLLFGFGKAYGAEFLIKRSEGRLTGWISYTWSKTKRKFNDIEHGQWFNAKYDRPHSLSVVTSYRLNAAWLFAAVFEFSSGSTYTPVVGRYLVANNLVNEYGRYNSARMPAYHRLDVSATWQLKKTSRIDSKINFSVFNVYNHNNPFFVYPEVSGDVEHYSFNVKSKEVTIFPVLPSVSWIFSF